MKHIYYFLVNLGKSTFISLVLLIISVSLYSLTIKGKVNYGDRCNVDFNQDVIKDYKYEGVLLKNSSLKCNTYYLEYDTVLEEKEIVVFLTSLAKLEKDNNIKSDLHVILKNDSYEILSTIVDYKVSYSISII